MNISPIWSDWNIYRKNIIDYSQCERHTHLILKIKPSLHTNATLFPFKYASVLGYNKFINILSCCCNFARKQICSNNHLTIEVLILLRVILLERHLSYYFYIITCKLWQSAIFQNIIAISCLLFVSIMQIFRACKDTNNVCTIIRNTKYRFFYMEFLPKYCWAPFFGVAWKILSVVMSANVLKYIFCDNNLYTFKFQI